MRGSIRKGKRQASVEEPKRANVALEDLVKAMGRPAAAVIACAILLAGLLRVLSQRGVDLFTFGTALLSLLVFVLLLTQLRVSLLILDRYRSPGKGDLAGPSPDLVARLVALPLWQDARIRTLLAIALLGNLTLFAYVSAQYSSLPPFLPLHYSASGEVDRLGTPPEVFMMPAIGVVVVFTNVMLATWLFRRERLASDLLIGASIFVQGLLLVATANIVSRA